MTDTPATTSYQAEAGQPPFTVHAWAVRVGGDVVATLWAGDRPHVGAVAAAHPRPSLADGHRRSATASVLTFSGHCEDEVVREAALQLAKRLDGHVVVSAGMHWDGLVAEHLATIRDNARNAVRLLGDQLQMWQDRRGLSTLSVRPQGDGWAWRLDDLRRGGVAEGVAATPAEARDRVEAEWRSFRVLAAHGLDHGDE